MLTNSILFLFGDKKQSFNNTIVDKAQELSYELADAITYVTERDKEKKELIRYEHDPADNGMILHRKEVQNLLM